MAETIRVVRIKNREGKPKNICYVQHKSGHRLRASDNHGKIMYFKDKTEAKAYCEMLYNANRSTK